jgi:hypothetical protein
MASDTRSRTTNNPKKASATVEAGGELAVVLQRLEKLEAENLVLIKE